MANQSTPMRARSNRLEQSTAEADSDKVTRGTPHKWIRYRFKPSHNYPHNTTVRISPRRGTVNRVRWIARSCNLLVFAFFQGHILPPCPVTNPLSTASNTPPPETSMWPSPSEKVKRSTTGRIIPLQLLASQEMVGCWGWPRCRPGVEDLVSASDGLSRNL